MFQLLLRILTQLHNLDSRLAAIEDEQGEQSQQEQQEMTALAKLQASLDAQAIILGEISASVIPPLVGTVHTQKFVFGQSQ